MTVDTSTHDRLDFDASVVVDDQMVLPFIEATGFTGAFAHEPSEEDEIDALCEDALARFAEALRRAVVD